MTRSNAVSASIRATTLLVLLTIAAAGCGDSPAAPEEPTGTGEPISWNASASGLPGANYERLMFNCAAGGEPGGVWGFGPFTDDSSICTAGVHAGAITLAAGGRVTIEFRPGMNLYIGGTRNGITSHSFESWPRSFIVIVN